jgi:hypothetical protein
MRVLRQRLMYISRSLRVVLFKECFHLEGIFVLIIRLGVALDYSASSYCIHVYIKTLLVLSLA